MKRNALKFTDLAAFFEVMESMGINGKGKDLIYEQDKLPYCSAYFIPTDLLPPTFDLNTICHFGGILTQVQEIRYLGTERFTSDFMIFPLSLTGYVEIDSFSPPTFVPETDQNDWATEEMIFVINIEDGAGKEFYLTSSGSLVGIADQSTEEPQEFKTYKQVDKQLSVLSQKYPPTCRIYALELHEFNQRRQVLEGEKRVDHQNEEESPS